MFWGALLFFKTATYYTFKKITDSWITWMQYIQTNSNHPHDSESENNNSVSFLNVRLQVQEPVPDPWSAQWWLPGHLTCQRRQDHRHREKWTDDQTGKNRRREWRVRVNGSLSLSCSTFHTDLMNDSNAPWGSTSLCTYNCIQTYCFFFLTETTKGAYVLEFTYLCL